MKDTSLGEGGRILARYKLAASYDSPDKWDIDLFSIISLER